jgi:hypothetical protein
MIPRSPVRLRTKTTTKKVIKRGRFKKSELAKLKLKLWGLCREITRKKYGNTCYTCGKGPLTGSSYQTGHFITSSNCSVELRYDLKNLAIQCYNCNINKSGNWVVFEKLLQKEHGFTYVEELKTRNLATKGKTYPISWFEEKIAQYEDLR